VRPSWLSAWVPSDVIAAIAGHVALLVCFGMLGLATGIFLIVSARQGAAKLVPAAAAVCLLTVAGNSVVADAVAADLGPNRAFVSEAVRIVGSSPAAVVPPFHTYGLHYYWPGLLSQHEPSATSA